LIEALEDMLPGTIGFRATGHVTREDYRDVLEPALRQAAEAGEIRLVYAVGPDFEEMEAGALWEDTKTGATLGIGHHSAWKRTAVVTDIDWMRRAIPMFTWMTPGEVRVFGLDELDDAKTWAAA
jgi:SpoIIAA-like